MTQPVRGSIGEVERGQCDLCNEPRGCLPVFFRAPVPPGVARALFCRGCIEYLAHRAGESLFRGFGG